MTIPKLQQLRAEIQVGMTQEAQKQPEEMGWCLAEKVFVNLPLKNSKLYAVHDHRCTTYHQSDQVLHSHCHVHTLTE